MTLTEIQDALTRLETRPRQSLGQNFLHDQNLARWIVSRLDLQPSDHVVEIGPGLGALTEYLVASGCTVTLIEKDGVMVRWLEEKFRHAPVELFHMDALKFDLRALYGRGPVKLVGNLPYYVSTPLIAKFASALSPASILVLTLQHEVAARLGAGPGTRDFGAMSVCSARRWDIAYERKLPASVFYPQPQVSSAVLTMRRKPGSAVPPCDDAVFESLVRRGFSERRKQLRNLLSEHKPQWAAICAALGVPETVRAEELDLRQWEKFTRIVQPAAAQNGAELFDVVDADDRVVDRQPRDVVHVNNLRHRAVHMVLFNSAGEILLQKRSLWKDRNAGLWDSAAAGHVEAGETYAAAAARELNEEIGVSAPLDPVGGLPCSERTGWEFIQVFRGIWDGPVRPAAMEIDTTVWFSPDQVRAWMTSHPGDFSPVFREVMALIR